MSTIEGSGGTSVKTEQTQAKAAPSRWEEDLKGLVQRAQQGDRTAVPALREYLEAHPEVWQEAGDVAKQAEEAWKRLIAGQDLLIAESLSRKVEALKAELISPFPTPLERLLVDRIAACWLALHHAEATAPRMAGATPAQHVAAQKRINICQGRYIHAIRALATMRKLLKPALAPIDIASRMTTPTAAATHNRISAALASCN